MTLRKFRHEIITSSERAQRIKWAIDNKRREDKLSQEYDETYSCSIRKDCSYILKKGARIMKWTLIVSIPVHIVIILLGMLILLIDYVSTNRISPDSTGKTMVIVYLTVGMSSVWVLFCLFIELKIFKPYKARMQRLEEFNEFIRNSL